MSDVIYPGKQADMIFMSSLVSKHFSLSIGFAHTFVPFFYHQKSCSVSLVFLSPAKPQKNMKKKENSKQMEETKVQNTVLPVKG